jgi:hypothetical protein
MRRAIAVTVVAGLAFGGLACGGMAAEPAFASGHVAVPAPTGAPVPGASPAPSTSPAPSGKPAATKTVTYDGYELSVPASWPVYHLAQDRSQCVRYDVHAVYLGTPGADQQCPAHLVGRTQTISIIPGSGVSYQRAQVGATGGTQVGSVPGVHGSIVLNSQQRELRVALGAAPGNATAVATYSDSPDLDKQMLASLRDSAATAQASPSPSQQRAAVRPAKQPASPKGRPSVSSAWHGLPSDWPTQVIAPPSKAPAPTSAPRPTTAPRPTAAPRPTSTPRPTSPSRPKPSPHPTSPSHPKPTPARTPPKPKPAPKPAPAKRPRAGFDTCTAPSIATMRAWRSAYSVIGVYIGGVNSACDYGNLSASWIRQAKALGWSTLPTYVGPQAPCYGAGVTISAGKAQAQGRAAADEAVSDAKSLGLPKGSPVYYDMEGYNEDNASCVSAVVNFLAAWTTELGAHGYVSGVYSSQDSGITNLNAAARAKHPRVTPKAVWIALWDGNKSLADGKLAWPVTDRAKQYAGPHEQRIGGTTLDIDSDYVDGPTAG